jgi:hypothetical protein
MEFELHEKNWTCLENSRTDLPVAHSQVVFDGTRIVVFDGRRAGERAASICALLWLPIVPSCILGNLIYWGVSIQKKKNVRRRITKGFVHASTR